MVEIKSWNGFDSLFAEIEKHGQILSNTVFIFGLFDSLNMVREGGKSSKTTTD